MDGYSHHFHVWGRDLSAHASDYLSGLLGTERRKNLEGIHGDIPDSNYQGLQHLISDSRWEEADLMAQVAQDVNGLLGGHRHSALLIDETTFVKKGDCSVGVYACLGRGERSSLVDFRLFFPEAWAHDAARCQKAQVPEEHRVHHSKLALALAMVKAAKARGVQFEWVLADTAYGCSLEFCRQIESLGYKYLLDVAGTTRVWDVDPKPLAPAENGGGRGRPTRRSSQGNAKARRSQLDEWVARHFESQSRMLTIRQTTKGPLKARVLVWRVWLWEEEAEGRTVVAREYEDGKIKISWTNAPEGSSAEELASMQAQRHWIERSFEDAKSQLGMAAYEVRKWRGWHHHMALVSLRCYSY